MVLPEGFVVPPWYITALLLAVVIGVVALLWALEPPVSDFTVLSFVPWMMFGSTLHVLHRLDAYPDNIAVLFTTPSVYVVTAIVAGFVWQIAIFAHAAGLQSTIHRLVGISGTGFFVVFAMFAIAIGASQETFEPFWPVIAVVLSGVVTAIAWFLLSLWVTEVAAITGLSGVVVLFGHTLDGISTAIGYDVLGASEEVPLSRMILEVGSSLPTAEFIGGGWLFVLVKIALPLAILGLFKEYVREEPRQARLVLLLIAAVGLGPGTHNVLLFALG